MTAIEHIPNDIHRQRLVCCFAVFCLSRRPRLINRNSFAFVSRQGGTSIPYRLSYDAYSGQEFRRSAWQGSSLDPWHAVSGILAGSASTRGFPGQNLVPSITRA